MDGNWGAFLFIWAIAEGIQWLRKRDFSDRMKTGAYWAVGVVSLSEVGQSVSGSRNPLLYLLTFLVLNSAVAFIIYWIRLKVVQKFD